MNVLTTHEEAGRLIESGAALLVAGDESVLARLPRGQWIGGTIPYFMTEQGGVMDRSRVFVTTLPPFARVASIATYDVATLPTIPEDYPENGCSFIILPAESSVHLAFAQDAASYRGVFNSPLVGWIAGLHLDDIASAKAKVIDGRSGQMLTDRAIAMHSALQPGKAARVDILNLFTQGGGDVLTFPRTGFHVTDCFVNGAPHNFADYLAEHKIDIRLPLVANYTGAMVNVSFRNVDTKKREVSLYAPVFDGTEYRIAAPVNDYPAEFAREMTKRAVHPVFSCNCILNYVYAGLEGKRTGDVSGPITFGEIAYMLLNQTLVYVSFDDVS
jgi:hypothetical protein